MRIAINGVGIAGPTLAWWLKKYGYEPVLFEKAKEFRTGGYVVDFWGPGYEVVEKMGLLNELESKSYDVKYLKCLNGKGKKSSRTDIKNLSKKTFGKFLSVKRTDISDVIYKACGNVETRFGTYIESLEQQKDGVLVTLSTGEKEKFDLVVGADGLHSHTRSLVFDKNEYEEFNLDAYVAVFELNNYEPRIEHSYIVSMDTKKQAAKFAIEGNKTLFMFTCRSELVAKEPKTLDEKKDLLKTVFKDMQWEVPAILKELDKVDNIYFDNVNQIRMDTWSKDRVVLIGDAAACPSLLAGQGSIFAIMEAYILAGELHKSNGNYQEAFTNYENLLKDYLTKKQKAALGNLAFFAPKNLFQKYLANIVMKVSTMPVLSKFVIASMFKDDFKLPEYK